MPLEQRQKLLLAYRSAVHAYNEALATFDESNFHHSLKRTERCRAQAEAARRELLHHEHLNVDLLDPKQPEPNRIVIIGSTVSLFNLSTGHWDLFELSVTGHPPSDALAYAPSPANDPGEWISDSDIFDQRQRENVRLYFTESGLAILREAGLEM